MNARALIGWNVRRVRVAKGLTQERLSFEAKIDRAYVGRVERGQENVTIDTVEMLALALSVQINELFAPIEAGSPYPAALKAGRKRKLSE